MKNWIFMLMAVLFTVLIFQQSAKADSLPQSAIKVDLSHQNEQARSAVRLSIRAASGSGIEQDIVDYISARFSDDSNVVISTVNPDWTVECQILDNQDRMGGQIRYNGTVTVKTLDGQVVGTVSVQKYNQDYSVEPGAPLNKVLVNSAAKEVIGVVGERAAEKIHEAVEIEIQAREQIAKANLLADKDNYDEAIADLKEIGRDSVHFQAVQNSIAQFEMEKHALELIHSAEVKAKSGRYVQALEVLKEVDPKSKKYKYSRQLATKYRSLLEAARVRAASNKLAKTKAENKAKY